MIDLRSLSVEVEALARRVGEIQLALFRTGSLNASAKLNQSDIVTEADRRSERIIIDWISGRFPDHSILSEESGVSGSDASRWQWVVDPLDGTTNFFSGLPFFAVSISLEYDRQPMMGVVYAPYLGEMFVAVRGEGAFLNGSKIRCSACSELSRAVLSTGFPVDKDTNPDNNLDNVTSVLPHIRGLRRLGSAAIDICYVAAGFLSGYWEMNLHRWDISAALLIAEEAGCSHHFFRANRGESIVVAPPALLEVLKIKIK